MLWFIIPIVAVVLYVIYEIRAGIFGFGDIFVFSFINNNYTNKRSIKTNDR